MNFKLFKISLLCTLLSYSLSSFAVAEEIPCPNVQTLIGNANRFDQAYVSAHNYYTAYTSQAVFTSSGHAWQMISLQKNMQSDEQAITQAKHDAGTLETGLNVYAERGSRYFTCYYIPHDVRAVTPV